MPAGEPGCPPRLAARPAARRGFTLIELLVVLAIIAMLLTLSVPRYLRSIDTAADTVLVQNLRQVREVIGHYRADTGQYPDSLDQLVERRYLQALPLDPVADSTTAWLLLPPVAGERGRIADIRSSAPGNNRAGRRYADL